MTVYVVTLNGLPQGVAQSLEGADRVIEAVKARFPAEEFRPVGPDGWSSRHVTSVRRVPMECHA